MSLRTSANRYAKALLDVAVIERADLAQIERDLTAIADQLAASGDLARAAERAGLPDAVRTAIISSVADRLGAGSHVKKLVVALTADRKLNLVPDLLASYRERLLAHQNIVRAQVSSAVPLAPEKTQALAESLSKVTGKKIELEVRVDPALLGGVVARIGSTVYDGSVKTQLERMRQQLVEQ